MPDSLGLLIKQINESLQKDANKKLEKQNLTLTQVGLITELGQKSNATATMKELEALLSVSQPTVVGIVKRLEQKGFVECFESPEDRRVKIVRLTKAGEVQGQIGLQYARECDDRMLAAIPPDQRDALRDMLEKIHKALKG